MSMARKPIHHERAGMLAPRERVWQAVRKLRTAFTFRDLLGEIRPVVNKDTIRTYLASLVAAGYLTTAKPSAALQRGEGHVYTLTKDAFEAPRVDKRGRAITQGTATLAMWRAMRVLGTFDYLDLARAATLGDVQVSGLVARSYIAQLHKAGYFRVVQASAPGKAARYQLVRYTGAEAPAITSRKCVFDRNLGAFTWEQPEQEVCDAIG